MSFDQNAQNPALSDNVNKGGAGTSGIAYTQAVQDFLHAQSILPVAALGYNESLEDFSFLPSS